MRMTQATDLFIADMRREGRIRSDKSEVAYRQVLMNHAEDVGNRDPRTIGREDIKRTLRRWPHPSTQAKRHSILASFYQWCVYEEIRETNPAEQVRRAKPPPVSRYRLTAEEMPRLLSEAVTVREQRIAYLGLLAGLRSAELRGLQGRHFAREGYIHVSADIAKGGRDRWLPRRPRTPTRRGRHPRFNPGGPLRPGALERGRLGTVRLPARGPDAPDELADRPARRAQPGTAGRHRGQGHAAQPQACLR